MASLVRQREQFLGLASRLHDGSSGLTDLLHIGIGGSDLGPRLVAEALNADDSAIRVHWLSTLDGRRFERLCRELNPATTGMVMASKSFSTEETITQATPRASGWARAGRIVSGLPRPVPARRPSSVCRPITCWSSRRLSVAVTPFGRRWA
jgi:glucose-6-phosphate isomerase